MAACNASRRAPDPVVRSIPARLNVSARTSETAGGSCGSVHMAVVPPGYPGGSNHLPTAEVTWTRARRCEISVNSFGANWNVSDCGPNDLTDRARACLPVLELTVRQAILDFTSPAPVS